MGIKVPYMSKAEFSRAQSCLQRMRDNDTLDLMTFMQTIKFDGFGLPDFEPVQCTIEEVAQLIGYQCIQLNGALDQDALRVIWEARRKFHIVGVGSDDDMAQERLELERIATRLKAEEFFRHKLQEMGA